MKLYYAPLACSMASRIAIYEAGVIAEFAYVDIHNDPQLRLLADGSDYRAINPLGQVPALHTDAGQLIIGNAPILQYIWDHYREQFPSPATSEIERYQLQHWLNFIATELQKGIFIPLLDRRSPDGAKSFATSKVSMRYEYLSKTLQDRQFLLEGFSVADAYLMTVLNWSQYAGISLSDWPTLKDYYKRIAKRPSVARALIEEARLYENEQAGRAVA